MASLNGTKYKLSSEQLQILKNEILTDPQSKGYSGKTKGGIVKILNEKPITDNPDPQSNIDGPSVTQGDILCRAGLTLVDIKKVQGTVDGLVIWNILMGLAEIDLTSPLAVECLNSLKTKSLLSNTKVNKIKSLGKIPDPSWKAFVTGQSRSEKLLGVGSMIEGFDVAASVQA